MINISFIGNLNSSVEFASKWREKLVPDQVFKGKELSSRIGHDRKMNWVNQSSVDKQREKTRQELQKEARQFRNKFNINKKETQSTTSSDSRIYKSNKTSISATGRERLKELKSAFNKRKLIGNAKKLGIGAVGLATLGAIGYGIARKIRSDKGRKRK